MPLQRRSLRTLEEGRPSKAEMEAARKKYGITAKMVKSGVKPAGVTWLAWSQAGGGWDTEGPSKPSSSKKAKGKSNLPYMNPAYRKKAKAEKDQERTTDLPVVTAKEVGTYLAARVHRLTKATWYASVKRGMERGELPDLKAWRDEAPGNGKYLRQLGMATLLAFGPKPKPQGQPQQMGWWGTAGKSYGMGSYSSSSKLPEPVYSAEEKKLRGMIKALGTVPRLAAGGIVFKTFEAPDVWDLPVLVSKVAPKYGSYFVFPKGGQDPGEHIHKTAAREVYEEAGVKAKVANSRSFTTKSRFHDRGKYDLTLVMNLLKKKFPKEQAFIDEQKDLIFTLLFEYENTSHYFVMRHLSGKPRKGAGKGHGAAEMAFSEWITLAEAAKRGKRLEDIIKGLMPVIRRMHRPTSSDEIVGYLPGKRGKRPA